MKFAEPKPPFCASCFQHSTDDHIDFEASWDGPVLERDGLKIPVDDLILCGDCVRRAAEMFGMIDPKRFEAMLEDAQAQIIELRKELEGKDDVISDLTYTVGALSEFPPKRKAGKPKFIGIPDEVKEELNSSKRRQAGQRKRYEEAKK